MHTIRSSIIGNYQYNTLSLYRPFFAPSMDKAIVTQKNPPTSIITFSSSIAPLCMYRPGCFTLVALKSCYKKCTFSYQRFYSHSYNPPFIAGHDDFVCLLTNVMGMCLIVSLCYSVHYWHICALSHMVQSCGLIMNVQWQQ